jgi:Ca2+/Na+ antiporter
MSIVAILLCVLVMAFTFYIYKLYREAEERSRFSEYRKNAIDWAEKDYTSNHRYRILFTKGIKAYIKDGRVVLESQSKL